MNFDCIIIGAGPAGGMTARILAGEGRRVLLLERRKVVGVPVQCGEGLSEDAFDDYDLPKNAPWVVKNVKGVKIITPNGKEVYFPRRGFLIRREGLDQWLVERAVEKGASLMTSTAVLRVSNTSVGAIHELPLQIWEVTTSQGIFQSPIVVVAAGPNYSIQGLPGPRSRAKNILAYEYKFKPEERFSDDYLWCYHSEDFQPGYLWVFERRHEVSIGIGGDGQAQKVLDEFCQKQGLDVRERISTHAGYIPDSPPEPVFAKEGLLWVGDSAGTVHPLTKGGIHGALYSGKRAGEVILKAVEKNDLSLLEEYQRKMERFPLTDPGLWKKNEDWVSLSNKTLNLAGTLLNGMNYDRIPVWNALKWVIKDPTSLKEILRLLSIQRAYKRSEKYAW